MTEKMQEVVAKAGETIAQAAVTTTPEVDVDSPDIVAAVQTKLRALNYPNVGPVTGEGGPKTEAAILDFQNRNGIDLTGKIDKPTLDALQTAPSKKLPVEQVNATITEIAPKVEAVRANWWSKVSAKLVAACSTTIWLLSEIVEQFPTATEMLTPVKMFFDGAPMRYLFAGVAVVAIIGVWKSGAVDKAIVKGYRDGTVGNDNKEAMP